MDRSAADLVARDHAQEFHGAMVARQRELGLHRRRGIEPARFERARHKGHARRDVLSGLLDHGPQAVVRVEVAVGVAERDQVVAEQAEVQGLLGSDARPVAVVGVGHAGETPDCIERQVDGVELDVRHGVQQRRAAVGGVQRAAGYLSR
jgi:hypothetical protein